MFSAKLFANSFKNLTVYTAAESSTNSAIKLIDKSKFMFEFLRKRTMASQSSNFKYLICNRELRQLYWLLIHKKVCLNYKNLSANVIRVLSDSFDFIWRVSEFVQANYHLRVYIIIDSLPSSRSFGCVCGLLCTAICSWGPTAMWVASVSVKWSRKRTASPRQRSRIQRRTNKYVNKP